jgi:antirestriction protein ArdC
VAETVERRACRRAHHPPALRHNAIPYRGINVITLWITATARGYACPIWLTYKQAQELGAQVHKGEHGELVVYANRITRTETSEKGEEPEREIPFLKGYSVFNAEQIDNLPPHFTAPAAPTLDPVARIAHAESFFAATGADIRHGGDRAYFAISADHVQMPPFETFRDSESYYATLAHECTHNAAVRIMPRAHLRSAMLRGQATRQFGIISPFRGERGRWALRKQSPSNWAWRRQH